jgi:hypothetical protein
MFDGSRILRGSWIHMEVTMEVLHLFKNAMPSKTKESLSTSLNLDGVRLGGKDWMHSKTEESLNTSFMFDESHIPDQRLNACKNQRNSNTSAIFDRGPMQVQRLNAFSETDTNSKCIFCFRCKSCVGSKGTCYAPSARQQCFHNSAYNKNMIVKGSGPFMIVSWSASETAFHLSNSVNHVVLL